MSGNSASWPEQLAAAAGRRTSCLPAGTSAVRLRHTWEGVGEASGPRLDACCLQYDVDGRRVRGGTVDRLYTRTDWQARTGEWWQTAQYSERGAAYASPYHHVPCVVLLESAQSALPYY